MENFLDALRLNIRPQRANFMFPKLLYLNCIVSFITYTY